MKKILGLLLVAAMLTTSVCAMAETFEGVGKGMGGDVKLAVTVEEGRITAIDVVSHNESAGISDPAFAQIPQAIIDNQSLAIDVVAGATLTSNGILGAVEAAAAAAGLDVDALKAAPVAKTEAVYENEMTADVVVIGAGGAGLAAATAAKQNGASVIVIEKMGTVGGNSIICGGIYNTPDADLQQNVEMSDSVKSLVENALNETPVNDAHAELIAAVKADYEAYQAAGAKGLFDSANWYALQTWNGGDKVADLDLVKQMANLSYDGLKWIESLGMEFRNSIGQGAGSLWQRTHTSIMQQGTGFLSTYVNCIANSDKITMLLSTTGTKLIQDESGRVTGVVCTDKAGNTFNISAAKGVILATGGFAANSKMVQENNTSGKWSDLSKVATTNRFQCSQGDGITMAVEAGASLTDMDQIQLLYFGNIVNGQITKYPQRDVSGTDQIIFINKEGKRFVNEGARRDVICLASFEQTDGMFYMLESGDGDQYVDIHSDEWRSADGFTFSYLEENGYVIAAETLEELAEKLGCQYEDLKATLDAFNESVETGVDEFGRTLYSTKLENGPWVATPRQACVHHTMGGVTIDPQTHVLDTDGNAIPGLYAAGEITGGIHGANRLGGNAVVDTVVFGKLAGENAATEQ